VSEIEQSFHIIRIIDRVEIKAGLASHREEQEASQHQRGYRSNRG
jgi:hypothetical protein